MSYIVNRTDGNIAAVVNDGVIDTSTSLNLVGKGYPNYAETVAEELIALLENHANILAPRNPLPGQLWYNKTDHQVQVYDDTKQKFKTLNNVIISTITPANPDSGDLWYHSDKKQLFFYRTNAWQLISPSYTVSQGRSELVVETMLDGTGNSHTVITLYNKNLRTVVISSDPEFSPSPVIAGFETVYPGINLPSEFGSVAGAVLNGSSTFSLTAYGLDEVADADYMHANADTSTIGNLTVINRNFKLGSNSEFNLSATNSNILMKANVDVPFILNGFGGSTLRFDNSTNWIAINKTTPTADLDVGGSINADEAISSQVGFNLNNSSITESTNKVKIKINGDDALTINSDGSIDVTSQVRADNLQIENDSTFNKNIIVSTLPTQNSHSANKRYVDSLVTYNTLPVGSVIMWYGAPVDVPTGWQICNGSNGTPDLRDRFVMGAGSSASVGQTDNLANGAGNNRTVNTNSVADHRHLGTVVAGGVHNHGGTTGNHVLTAGEVAGHTHTYSDLYGLRDDAGPAVYDRNGNRLQAYTGWGDDNDNDSGAPIFRDWQTDSTGNSDPHNHPIADSTSHTHDFNSDPAGSHSHSVSFDSRPSWTALYFIMKISNVLLPPNF